MDPLATLGLGAPATPEEVAAAYRALAKRWHPDRVGAGPDAARRMAEINAAYDLLREGGTGAPDLRGGRARQEAARASGGSVWGEEPRSATAASPQPQRASSPAGHWLPEATRRSIGRELLAALASEERVELVTPTATWKSPRALLVLTDRRLLWLLDDVISHRVHSLRWRDVGRVEHRPPRRLRAPGRCGSRRRSGASSSGPSCHPRPRSRSPSASRRPPGSGRTPGMRRGPPAKG